MPKKLSAWNLAVRQYGSIPAKGTNGYKELVKIWMKIKGKK